MTHHTGWRGDQGNRRFKKDIAAIVAQHEVPYVAISVAPDFVRKVEKPRAGSDSYIAYAVCARLAHRTIQGRFLIAWMLSMWTL